MRGGGGGGGVVKRTSILQPAHILDNVLHIGTAWFGERGMNCISDTLYNHKVSI